MFPQTLLLTALGVMLVLLNGFFVASEFAIVKLRMTQAQDLARTGGLRGRVLGTVRTHLDAYLSACQLGITLASLGLGWIGEPAFADLLEPALAMVGVTDLEIQRGIAFGLAFALISFLHIVVGELAPKSIAIRKTTDVAIFSALPLYLFYWLMYPFIYVLNGAANFIVRRMGVELATEGDAAHSQQELHSVLRASHRHGELDSLEARLLVRSLEFSQIVVGDLMRPITELAWLPLDEPIENVLNRIRTQRFTRYPVRDPASNRFAGLLHIKDLLLAGEPLHAIKGLRPYLRRLPSIGESAPVPQLLATFRQGSTHFALATDEHGNEIGFVTFEHLIEAIMGPVEDEFSKADQTWKRSDDGSLIGHASLSLLSLEDALERPVPEVNANSVGGLVLEQLGRLPAAGERIAFPNFEIEIMEVNGPRIERVRVRPTAVARASDSDY